ncbi:hypothetical protein C884_01412 [Kocuria palustris PEL]|uniref:Uncharacterized protein n=1 Tax=Kocuria palustris PEL TaxID=1236550 RepID=M2YB30_9MICC|nr:hypothetical protein C884_01412 [Kocuria palustris PEL]
MRRGETRAHGYLCGFVRAQAAVSGPRGRRPGGGRAPGPTRCFSRERSISLR